jgi:transporter family protein
MKTWIIPICITFVLWGIQGFVAKLTTQYINPMSALLYNIVGAFIVGIVILYLLNFSPQVHAKGITLAVFMGALGILGILGMLYAMRQGKVSVVTVISALYPLVSILLAYFILKEPVTLKEGVGIAFALVALVLFST